MFLHRNFLGKILLSCLLIFSISCESGEEIPTSNYQPPRGIDTLSPILIRFQPPVGWSVDVRLLTIEKHQYLYLETGSVNGGIAIEHYPDCLTCTQKSKLQK